MALVMVMELEACMYYALHIPRHSRMHTHVPVDSTRLTLPVARFTRRSSTSKHAIFIYYV